MQYTLYELYHEAGSADSSETLVRGCEIEWHYDLETHTLN
jgi:hypothetical protein